MDKIIKEIYSLDKLILSSILLWIYRIGFTLTAIVGILMGLSEMSQSFGGGLFTIFIATPLALLSFRIWIELVYLLVGIYQKLSSINDKLSKTEEKIEEAVDIEEK